MSTAAPIPARWYVLAADGRATLCSDQVDAEFAAKEYDEAWPSAAPHRAVQMAEVSAAAQPAGEPLFLLYTGQIDSGGEQDEWETEADSARRVDAFCAARPGQTIGLFPHPPAAARVPLTPAQQHADVLFRLLVGVEDIHRDECEHAPEDRVYADGAMAEAWQEARAMIAKIEAASREATPPAAARVPLTHSANFERAADMLTAYAELIRRDGATNVEQHHYLPEVEFQASELRKAASQEGGA